MDVNVDVNVSVNVNVDLDANVVAVVSLYGPGRHPRPGTLGPATGPGKLVHTGSRWSTYRDTTATTFASRSRSRSTFTQSRGY